MSKKYSTPFENLNMIHLPNKISQLIYGRLKQEAYKALAFVSGEKLPQETVIYHSTESKISKKDKNSIGS